MPNTFAPANLQWLGIARQVDYATPASAPSLFIPVDTPAFHATIPPLVDTNIRGSMAVDYNQIGGMRFDTITFKTNAYIDSAYFLLRALLGYPDQVTGASDPYTHQTALQNTGNNGQPAASTLFWADGSGKTQKMPGAQASSVKVTIKPDQLVSIEATFIGLPSTAIDTPTNTPTTALPWPSWNTVITIGGVASTVESELSFEYKRATEPIMTVTGTQSPYAIFAGPVNVTGSFTAVYQGITDVNWVDFLANIQPVFKFKAAPAGDAVHYLEVVHSVMAYDDVTVAGTNKWMEVKATVKAIANATDAIGGLFSPAHATLLNGSITTI